MKDPDPIIEGLRWLEDALLSGATIAYQDGQWYVFAKDGEGLRNAPTIEMLLLVGTKISKHQHAMTTTTKPLDPDYAAGLAAGKLNAEQGTSETAAMVAEWQARGCPLWGSPEYALLTKFKWGFRAGRKG